MSDQEITLVCPYDVSHQIRSSRMQFHIVKCQQNHSHKELLFCMFDVTHVVPSAEYQHHLENCPQRIHLDVFIYVPEDVDTEKYPVPSDETGLGETTWDSYNVTAYDPMVKCNESFVKMKLDVASSSKRSSFKASQRNRIQELTNNASAKNMPQNLSQRKHSYEPREQNIPEYEAPISEPRERNVPKYEEPILEPRIEIPRQIQRDARSPWSQTSTRSENAMKNSQRQVEDLSLVRPSSSQTQPGELSEFPPLYGWRNKNSDTDSNSSRNGAFSNRGGTFTNRGGTFSNRRGARRRMQ